MDTRVDSLIQEVVEHRWSLKVASAFIVLLVVLLSAATIALFATKQECRKYKSLYCASIGYIEDGLPNDGKQEIMEAINEVIDEEAKKSK